MNHAVFSALGTMALALSPRVHIPRHSYLPEIPLDRHCVYIPIAFYSPLHGCRDDVFFKLCKMHGVLYDANFGSGTLFFLLDSVIGGAVSVLCIGNSRFRAIEIAVQTLTFISNQCGREHPSDLDPRKKWESLTAVLIKLKRMLKKEKVILIKEDKK